MTGFHTGIFSRRKEDVWRGVKVALPFYKAVGSSNWQSNWVDIVTVAQWASAAIFYSSSSGRQIDVFR